jgi:hypothetical protein
VVLDGANRASSILEFEAVAPPGFAGTDKLTYMEGAGIRAEPITFCPSRALALVWPIWLAPAVVDLNLGSTHLVR